MPKPANSGPATDLLALSEVFTDNGYQDWLLLPKLRLRDHYCERPVDRREPIQHHDRHAPGHQVAPDQQGQVAGAGQSVALDDDRETVFIR